MPNALLEIGCEEIPARFMPEFLADLKQKAEEKLKRERLSFSAVTTVGTCRRLTLFIEGLPAKQTDQTDEVRGPAAEIAFDKEGKPTRAALGFAGSQKINVASLTVRTTNNRNYVYARVVRKGKPAADVLKTLFPEIIGSLYQPLAMRWSDLDFKFIRPIHSLVALLDNKVIKFELAGIKSDNKTFGHRYSVKPSPSGRGGQVKSQRVRVADLKAYKTQLARLGVAVDQAERKAAIKKAAGAAAQQAGAQALVTDDLLSEVTFLVENPKVYAGRFKAEFIGLPQEVLITSMQKNQKYFPLVDGQGKLLPRFAVVTDNCPNPKVIAGNEKVLSARLSDARFFFEEDKKVPLKLRLPDLEKVAFLEKLGTIYNKTERLARLAVWLGERSGTPEQEIKTARRAAELCKADLTTKMVFEFPELQGTMGREYALLSGEEPKAAAAIYEHYLPRFADDKLPASAAGTLVALADRLDSLVGAFSAGYMPTGSEDPYGLRRAAHGIIRIVLEKKLDFDLAAAVDRAHKLYEPTFLGYLFNKGETGYQDLPRIKQELLAFVANRLRPLLLERGTRYDVADAALAGFTDILDVAEKASALNSLAKEPWLAGVVASADRLSRIVAPAGGQAAEPPREQVLEHDLTDQEEKSLHELYLKINWTVAELVKKEQWAGAARELAKLTEPIERFFDKVLVMHEEPRLRANRLALLKSLEKLYLSVADFRKIVIEGLPAGRQGEK
ncbi:MAG: glycine--tRNA ligase subunit beta [Candidatus Saganbacteria bacterium]|nr:glycine--tRNA ligase subunit beta [Candidatus Saganbacteria bacterium]